MSTEITTELSIHTDKDEVGITVTGISIDSIPSIETIITCVVDISILVTEHSNGFIYDLPSEVQSHQMLHTV